MYIVSIHCKNIPVYKIWELFCLRNQTHQGFHVSLILGQVNKPLSALV